MSNVGTVKISMDEVHDAIQQYVERKYGVKAITDSIHYRGQTVSFQGATVKYELTPLNPLRSTKE
jgi:hypothetical protein